MISLWLDVRYAVRAMRSAPGFSAVVIATLALAIGVNTAIFSVVDGVLLRALPYRDPDRLVILYEGIPKALSGPIGFSAPDFKAFEARVQSFEGIAAFGGPSVRAVGQGSAGTCQRRAGVRRDIRRAGRAAGSRPFLYSGRRRRSCTGRRPDGSPVATKVRRGSANPRAKHLLLDRRSYTVVGVMPPRFVFPNRGPLLNNEPADLYVPISFTES